MPDALTARLTSSPAALRVLRNPGGASAGVARWVLVDGGRGRVHARTVDEHVVVIGAGPAGLAAAWAIGRAGVDPLVVDQAVSVAALVARGDSTPEIARGMFVSRRTVQTYISRILAKLGAKGRVEIVREALRQGRLALAGRSNRRRCGKVSSHDHYSQPGAAGCLGLCPVLGTGQAAGRDMHRMTQPGLLRASVRRRRITSATLAGDAT
jgi:DNA-binding CsgD family transcriptional regulator